MTAAAEAIKESAPARSQQTRQGLAHINSNKDRSSATLITPGHQLLHRRVETSLYVRNVAGAPGQASIVKNGGKEKGTVSARVTSMPTSKARPSSQQPRLLARCALASLAPHAPVCWPPTW